jgi:hypothetical protein
MNVKQITRDHWKEIKVMGRKSSTLPTHNHAYEDEHFV